MVKLIGYTTNAASQGANQVTLAAAGNATAAGSDDASGTLQIHTNNVKIYNINIRNTLGKGVQAIALSNWADMVGCYACGMYGYQVGPSDINIIPSANKHPGYLVCEPG